MEFVVLLIWGAVMLSVVSAIKSPNLIVDFVCSPQIHIENSGVRKVEPLLSKDRYDCILWSYTADGKTPARKLARKIPTSMQKIKTRTYARHELSGIVDIEKDAILATWQKKIEEEHRSRKRLRYSERECEELQEVVRLHFMETIIASWNTHASQAHNVLFVTYGTLLFLTLEALFPEHKKYFKDIEILHYDVIRTTQESCILLK